LNKLKGLKLVLSKKGIPYQNILAIEDSYSEYVHTICHNLCSGRQPTLDAVINALNNEAHCNDPVKTAAVFAAKKSTENTTSTNSNHQNTEGDPGSRHGPSCGFGHSRNNNGSSQEDSQFSATPTS
jgi:hypothetical protein